MGVMRVREHCSDCDRPLGKHRFVSPDGSKFQCARCFGLKDSTPDKQADERHDRHRDRALMRRRLT
jgi:hypothetical protein